MIAILTVSNATIACDGRRMLLSLQGAAPGHDSTAHVFQQCGAAATVSLISTGASRGAAGDKPESQAKAAAPARFGDGRDWFLDQRFGMFVHWGLYSLLGWHEQHQWRGRVPRRDYVKLASG